MSWGVLLFRHTGTPLCLILSVLFLCNVLHPKREGSGSGTGSWIESMCTSAYIYRYPHQREKGTMCVNAYAPKCLCSPHFHLDNMPGTAFTAFHLSRARLPSLVQLGLDVDGLGFQVGKVTRAGGAVELPLPGKVVINLERSLFPLLFLLHQLVLDLIYVFSPVARIR